MEYSLLGSEGSEKTSYLGSEIGFLVDFSLGGPGSKVGSMESLSLGASRGPHGCPGGGSYS